ncbi:MAG: methyltransferase domain-containing protein [Flavobacteriales bacterium]
MLEGTGTGSRAIGAVGIPLRLDPEQVRSRFDRIAGLYRFFELLFLVPAKLRPLSVEQLALQPGERAVSVGCGQGRSLPLMAKAVGPTGHVTGVDLSSGMLEHAYERILRKGIHNVAIIHADIRSYKASAPLDAVLFSFSLTTFGDPQAILQQLWEQLRPGGRLVVADAQLPPRTAFLLKPLLPLIRWFLERTVLGDPDMRPIEELRRLGPPVHVQRMRMGFYFIATVIKPES